MSSGRRRQVNVRARSAMPSIRLDRSRGSSQRLSARPVESETCSCRKTTSRERDRLNLGADRDLAVHLWMAQRIAGGSAFYMLFSKRLRDGIRRGRIRCSVRIWKRPHVKVDGRYRMDEGQIVVDSIVPIGIEDITYDLARESG